MEKRISWFLSHVKTFTYTHTLNNSTSVLVCLWDFTKYRPFPTYETSLTLENKALCLPVVTGYSISKEYFDNNTFTKQAFRKQNNWIDFPGKISLWLFHWVMGLWFFILYCIKTKITWIFLPNLKPKGKTRARIWRHDLKYYLYLY